ncbi:death-associated inhibitor of apoptosis 2-like isoform X2 [Saccostrea cucullata]|uniref:death-associated inhibitor of apoptosis 2-like isoform X2 n=1 Tax=Saccostrea cuccullata TaxID=36930 RepID=UPI002ED5A095
MEVSVGVTFVVIVIVIGVMGIPHTHCDPLVPHRTCRNVPISRVDAYDSTPTQQNSGAIALVEPEADSCVTSERTGHHTGQNPIADLSRSVLQTSDVNSYIDRLSTFTDWPRQMSQQPEELAAAGFVYTGVGDRVQCSFCGLQLHKWEPNETAFHEHLRWFPQCPFITEYFQQPLSIISTSGSSVIVDPAVVREVLQCGFQQRDIEKAMSELSINKGPCMVCANESRGTLFLPCTHICCCRWCGQLCCLCPLCRARVKARIQVYIS